MEENILEMIKNYFLVTVRNFWRNSNYAFINILGLGVGISACIVIFLLVRNELSFDRFNSKFDSIYRIVTVSSSGSGEEFSSSSPYPLIGAFRNDFPDVPLATQIHHQQDVLAQIDDRKFKLNEIIFADSLFFKVFDFEVIAGNPEVALGEPGKLFLTESLAKRMGVTDKFPARIKLSNVIEGEVAGIVKDPPANSHIQFEMIVPMKSLTKDFVGGFPIDRWGVLASAYTYVVLPKGMEKSILEKRLPAFGSKYLEKDDADRRSFHLQALEDIHFDERFIDNPTKGTNASRQQLAVMVVLGVFILSIGCINFVNLSTALAIRKSKEIGVRKTLGAAQTQLSVYFLFETFFITVIAVLLSLGALEWSLPFINTFLGKDIELRLFSDYELPLFLLVLITATTLLSGVYPAWILSGYNPAVVLKNKITAQSSSGGGVVRKVLVVCQFIIAQVLIIGTLIISDQMRYFRSKPLGFDKEAVIQVRVPGGDENIRQAFRDRLLTDRNIRSVAFTIGAPTSDNNLGTGFYLSDTPNDFYPVGVKAADYYYMETYGIKLKAGRWFTEAEGKMARSALPREERRYKYVINESAMRRLGFRSPEEIIGRNIGTGINDVEAEVIGVVHDFHISSLHNEIQPVVFMNFDNFFVEAGIKMNSENFTETLAMIEKNWNDLYPDYYFEYFFLDQQLEALYKDDQRTFALMKVLSGVSIFVGCLGLYGLISFMANQKLKEVGVRKVMGASVVSIVLLFSRDFIRLILIAFAIAAPLGWYFMNQWLQSFAYHIEIHWSVFLISVLATLVIALGTISYRSMKAALANPADTLRTE